MPGNDPASSSIRPVNYEIGSIHSVVEKVLWFVLSLLSVHQHLKNSVGKLVPSHP